ncbi:autophagy-related protein 9B isoform X5 [Dromaius novaehollandiae]|uniref:autophagy-related protein 9B isoform X5 n=1 Tax=Dromaius novaehollandiae TaxID=8790 RepID=UPI00311EDA11
MAAQGEYQRLEDEEDSPPGEEELLVHVTEGLRDSWHHIKNLDNFFTKIYHFHQKNGFACMMLSDLFELAVPVRGHLHHLPAVLRGVRRALRQPAAQPQPRRDARPRQGDAARRHPARAAVRPQHPRQRLDHLPAGDGGRVLAVPPGQGALRPAQLLGDPHLLRQGAAHPLARAADVRAQEGADGAGHLPPHPALQELHRGHGQQVAAARPLPAAPAGPRRLPHAGPQVQPGAAPLLGPRLALPEQVEPAAAVQAGRPAAGAGAAPGAHHGAAGAGQPAAVPLGAGVAGALRLLQLRRGHQAGAGQPGRPALVALRPPLPAPLQRAQPRAAGAPEPRLQAGHQVHELLRQPAARRAGQERGLLRRLHPGRAHRPHRLRRGRAHGAAHPHRRHRAGAGGHGGQVLHPGRAHGVVPRAAAAGRPGPHPLHARPLAGQRRQGGDARRDGPALPVQGGLHPGGAAEPHPDAPHPHLRPARPRPGHRRLLPQLHGGGGGGGRHLLLRPAGRPPPRPPAVALGGAHGGLGVPAGRERQDGAVADALRPQQPALAAAAAQRALPQPPQGEGAAGRGRPARPGRGAAGRLAALRRVGRGAGRAAGQRAGPAPALCQRAAGAGAALGAALRHGRCRRQRPGVPVLPAARAAAAPRRR